MLTPSSSLDPITFFGANKEELLEKTPNPWAECGICHSNFTDPVVLRCLHVFDAKCISALQNDNLTSPIKCPECNTPIENFETLPSFDNSITSIDQEPEINTETKFAKCTSCTSGNEALYRCLQCRETLCTVCRDVHKIPLCDTCHHENHHNHVTLKLDIVPGHLDNLLSALMETCTTKEKELREINSNLHNVLCNLTTSCENNRQLIIQNFELWKDVIEQTKELFLSYNRRSHDDVESKLLSRIDSLNMAIDHIGYARSFVNTYVKKCSTVSMCTLAKNVIGCFDKLSKLPFSADCSAKVDYTPSTLSQIKNIVQQNFGHIESTAFDKDIREKPDLSCFRSSSPEMNVNTTDVNERLQTLSLYNQEFRSSDLPKINNLSNYTSAPLRQANSKNGPHPNNSSISIKDPTFMSSNKLNSSPISTWGDLCSVVKTTANSVHNVTTDNSIRNNWRGSTNGLNGTHEQLDDPSNDAAVKPKLTDYCRLRDSRCNPMYLWHMWGSPGSDGLNSPHGFCLGLEEEIVVADTKNHRIKIFAKDGRFIFSFGIPGRDDGLLWYPRKVAVIRQSQLYVVCDKGPERSRMQLFTKNGLFVRCISIRYIDIVAGLAIDRQGNIAVVDSATPSVYVVSEKGNLISWFDCANYMMEPSDLAIHGQEYYICDFKGHCVVVFHEDGTFLQRFGGQTITDFPNGIDVSAHGDVLVGDSHGNQFHVAVFSRNGDLLDEFVCKQTKVNRSCCLKITTEGYVVTLVKSTSNVILFDTLFIC